MPPTGTPSPSTVVPETRAVRTSRTAKPSRFSPAFSTGVTCTCFVRPAAVRTLNWSCPGASPSSRNAPASSQVVLPLLQFVPSPPHQSIEQPTTAFPSASRTVPAREAPTARTSATSGGGTPTARRTGSLCVPTRGDFFAMSTRASVGGRASRRNRPSASVAAPALRGPLQATPHCHIAWDPSPPERVTRASATGAPSGPVTRPTTARPCVSFTVLRATSPSFASTAIRDGGGPAVIGVPSGAISYPRGACSSSRW